MKNKIIEVWVGKEYVIFNLEKEGVQSQKTFSGHQVNALLLANGMFRIRSYPYLSLELPVDHLSETGVACMSLDVNLAYYENKIIEITSKFVNNLKKIKQWFVKKENRLTSGKTRKL